MLKTLLLISSVFFLLLLSCKKDSFITDSKASLYFSSDSVLFDTVFVSTGSITQSIKIINPNNQKLMLTDVKLMGGSNSVFKLNIDGNSTITANNIELAPNDSIYVFVSVLINPNNNNQAFILQDSIQVAFNGNQKYIQLQAYGQNAHFFNNKIITTNTTWSNDLPYVILGGLQIDSGISLKIQQGCKIYFHANAPLIVNGNLHVQGADTARVYFLGDRLDYPYNNFPGAWPGIYLMQSSNDNMLQYAVIENAYQGIAIEGMPTDANSKLSLNNSIIQNISDAGILALQTDIAVQNCLVSNCGRNIAIGNGGNYSFTNCTIAGFSNDYVQHSNPSLSISNGSTGTSGNLIADLNASFINCLIWGDSSNVTDEVVVNKQNGSSFNVGFSNCLWRLKNSPANISATNILTSYPMFDSVNNQKMFYDFHLKAGSPAIDQGISTPFAFDLDGNPRIVGLATDIGCYEKQ